MGFFEESHGLEVGKAGRVASRGDAPRSSLGYAPDDLTMPRQSVALAVHV